MFGIFYPLPNFEGDSSTLTVFDTKRYDQNCFYYYLGESVLFVPTFFFACGINIDLYISNIFC